MIEIRGNKLYLFRNGETVEIFAQGKDALRVRATMNSSFEARDWALEGAEEGKAEIVREGRASLSLQGAAT